MRFTLFLGALASTALAMPAAAPAPEPDVTHNGVGTVFSQEGGTGSCGIANPDSALIVAISNYWQQNESPGPYCGRRIQATNTGSNDGVGGAGNSITVLVQDTCPSCGENDLDFSIGAWNQLTNNAPYGTFNVQWPINITAKMTTRPTVTIATAEGKPSGETHPLPAVFKSPIRPDIVQAVHTGMAKNKRQPYAVSEKAGHQTSAESWGTGRAVARIPRVSGSGTHRAGQAAFGNQCRSGRMFAPTKVWRKWHKKINLGQKRFATTSALAASSVPSLLLARGHEISSVPEVPLVISSSAFQTPIVKTKEALALLRAIGAGADLAKVTASRKLRAGKGKLRGRRYKQRRGPLIVYEPEADGKELVKAFRNIPGVETSSVFALNLLQLAPGGHLGRFIVWTSSAFAALDTLYGDTTTPSALKKDFLLPSNIVANADLTRLINSSEVQAVVRPAKGGAKTKRAGVQKKNPLKNRQVLLRLNPYAKAFAEKKLGSEKFGDGKPERAGKGFSSILKED